ncbi:hypothetical protein [Pseudomonas oryziphila]|uniref:Uncharacterized protein n=1 Tax=Pseudomonas entomophila TaxID=312306 RepID=A0A3Q8U2G3_9PSED|nr:hypothetical protein [Pseudomonas oryziphila]AZL70014.1 hypothetical protein EJA05_20820 [Pseudomonas oryziphila]
MNYLQKEIEGELLSNSIEVVRVLGVELDDFLNYVEDVFYVSYSGLDPRFIRETSGCYDADFWKKVVYQPENFVYLMVLDDEWHVWRFQAPKDLQLLLGKTSGFIYWLIDSKKKVLVFCGDSDEVVWSRAE